jgi:hypothetical protein
VSDFKKVRVRLVDADGVEHSVVGWRLPGDGNPVLSEPKDVGLPASFWYLEYGDDVEVTPVVELPTGLGAVVEVTYNYPISNDGDCTDRLVLTGKNEWYATIGQEVFEDRHILGNRFVVLSEGVTP